MYKYKEILVQFLNGLNSWDWVSLKPWAWSSGSPEWVAWFSSFVGSWACSWMGNRDNTFKWDNTFKELLNVLGHWPLNAYLTWGIFSLMHIYQNVASYTKQRACVCWNFLGRVWASIFSRGLQVPTASKVKKNGWNFLTPVRKNVVCVFVTVWKVTQFEISGIALLHCRFYRPL